mgnify:CR=1 FL=1
MAKVNVVIVDATGNKEQKVGLPDDIKCGIIMVKLVEKIKLPTVIFDEIDTGVSGRIADAMGEIIADMATKMQVVDITHLPQVAALGSRHYKVHKEETVNGTVTNIVELEQQERVREIAQMMSGEVLTDAAINAANLLLSQS